MEVSFRAALANALYHELDTDPSVFLYGVGLGTRDLFFGSLNGLMDKFSDRILDTPVAENSLMGFGLGAAINGMRPVYHHIRADFLLLAMDQLVNMVAPYIYSTGGKSKVPLTIRAVIGRGWGQGWQHSKSLTSWLAHIPGLTVVMPVTPRDAKGLLAGAIRHNSLVIFLEHRWLYFTKGEVPSQDFTIPLEDVGRKIQSRILLGDRITIAATGWMAIEAIHAAALLHKHHRIYAEVVAPRILAPLDITPVTDSVQKTHHCLVVDNDWLPCGLSAEIAAQVQERCFGRLKSPVIRLGWKHTPCPTARPLEEAFYVNSLDIVREAEQILGLKPADLSDEKPYSYEVVRDWKGPF